MVDTTINGGETKATIKREELYYYVHTIFLYDTYYVI